jgi:hypothetical protein
VIERPRPPSPRWAIECAFGAHLQATGAHGAALPLNGLIRLDTVRAADVDDNPAHAAIVQAEALRDVLEHLYSLVAKARDTRQALADRYRAKRANSRVPQLYGLLASFGPLRSSQIEAVLGVTRLGVGKCWRPCRKPATWPSKPFRASSSTRSRAADRPFPHRPGRRTEPVFQRGDRGL